MIYDTCWHKVADGRKICMAYLCRLSRCIQLHRCWWLINAQTTYHTLHKKDEGKTWHQPKFKVTRGSCNLLHLWNEWIMHLGVDLDSLFVFWWTHFAISGSVLIVLDIRTLYFNTCRCKFNNFFVSQTKFTFFIQDLTILLKYCVICMYFFVLLI